MKSRSSLIFFSIALLLSFAVSASAIGPSRIGVHAAYSAGGDVEDEQLGLGGQLEFALGPNLFIELSASTFSDEWAEDGLKLEADIVTFGLSGILRAPIADTVQVYGLGGINYNSIDMDAGFDRAALGLPANVDAQADIDIDDELGFHLGAGINVEVTPNVEIFAEYRYTLLSVDAETTVKVSGAGMDWSETETTEEDYDFGLFKAGLNFMF